MRAGSTAALASIVNEVQCRRRQMLLYFGERRGACNAAQGEELCDVCRDPKVRDDGVQLGFGGHVLGDHLA